MDRNVSIVASPNPFSSELVTVEVPEGMNIQDLLGVGARQQVSVWVNDEPIARSMWKHVRPKAGTTLVVKMLPAGDDARKVVRTILQIVIIAVAFMLFPDPTLAHAFLRAGAAVVGMLILNAIIPPQMPGIGGEQDSFNRKMSVTGTRNQANFYGAVPRVYGKHRIYPPYAALPYTELLGEDQYLRVLFNLGYGPLATSELKIGETVIGEFEGVEYQIGEAPDLFSNSVTEEALALVLNVSEATWTRTSEDNSDEISVDIAFPLGLFSIHAKKGTTLYAETDFLIEYREADTFGDWLNVKDATGFQLSSGFSSVSVNNIRVRSSLRETRRVGVRWKVANGQYDVRVTRKTTSRAAASGAGEDNLFSDSTWTILRSVEHTLPSQIPGTVLVALRIKATDQLNGLTDRFNLVAESLLEAWDDVGSAWVLGDPNDYQNRNPAWVYLDILTGSATPRPLNRNTRFMLDDFVEWAEDCELRGYTYDYVIDSGGTVFELAKDVASIGRASFGHRDGKYTVVRDTPQSVPVQIITPRNSNEFRMEKAFADEIHAIRARFINPAAGYQQDEMYVYDRGYNEGNATAIEVMEFRGATSTDHVWDMARYYLAVLRLRQSTYSATMDFENLVATRGDLVRLAHPTIDVSTGFGRIKSAVYNGSSEATSVVVDSPVSMNASGAYRIRIRTEDNVERTSLVTTVAGDEVNTLTLTTPLADVASGDLFVFGVAGQDVRDLVVSKIEYQENLGARVSCAHYSIGVLEAGLLWRTFAPADVNTTSNRITLAGVDMLNDGDSVVFSSTGTLPTNIVGTTVYFVVGLDSTSIQISTTVGGSALNIAAQGTGVLTMRRVAPGFDSMASIIIDPSMIQCPPPEIISVGSGDNYGDRDFGGVIIPELFINLQER